MYSSIFIFSLYFLHSANGNDCDKLGTIIYEDIGCKPVTQEGKLCPIKYECDLEVKNNTCLFRGQQIGIGDHVSNDLIYGNCHVGCTCFNAEELGNPSNGENIQIGNTFTCAILDCIENIGGGPPGLGCHRTYQLNKCCSTGELCQTPGSTTSKCTVKPNQTVLEGQTFYPPNSCLKCVCPKNFNGKFEEPHCTGMKCAAQITHQKEINGYCAPFYDEKGPLCCPSAWICPKTTDKIEKVDPKDKQNSDLKCKFGAKMLELGDWLESTAINSWTGQEIKAKCECILPPFLTCTKIEN